MNRLTRFVVVRARILNNVEVLVALEGGFQELDFLLAFHLLRLSVGLGLLVAVGLV